MTWAFGPTYKNVDAQSLLALWERRHGKLGRITCPPTGSKAIKWAFIAAQAQSYYERHGSVWKRLMRWFSVDKKNPHGDSITENFHVDFNFGPNPGDRQNDDGPRIINNS